MADKRTTPEAPESAPQAASERSRRKKRAAPTIDLTATEVPPPQEAAPQPDPQPQPDPPAAAEAAAPRNSGPPETPPKPSGGAFGLAALAGGAAGVAATLLVLLGLYVAGLLPLQHAPSATTTMQPVANGQTLDVLAQRISKIEQTIGKITPDDENLAEHITALRNSVSSLSTDLATLYRNNDEIAANANNASTRAEAVQKALTELSARLQELSKTAAAGTSTAEFDALHKRIAALEQSTQLARDDIAKASAADLTARLALSAASLRDAVTSGAPFAAELAQAKALGADDKLLAPLASLATTGVPAAPALAHELNALLPAMIKIANASAPQGGFLEKLEANAGKLMRFRSLNTPAGDDASSVLARLEIDTAKADIAAALDDLGKLDSATHAPAQGWIEKARTRQAALAAARQFAADTARALGPKAATQ